MASELVKAGLDVTLIPDAAIFAVMSRVNKVILGTHAVLANGGLLNLTGSRMLASAARHHHVPVVICTGLYKLAPIFPYDEEHLNSHSSPDAILPFANGIICFLCVFHICGILNMWRTDMIDRIDVINPMYDYVPPEMVSMFITNQYICFFLAFFSFFFFFCVAFSVLLNVVGLI